MFASVGSLIGVAISPPGLGHHAIAYASIGGIVGALVSKPDDRVTNAVLGSILGTVIGSLLDGDHEASIAAASR